MKNQTCEIIISTCHRFSDLWDANILLLNRNWPDRKGSAYLVTDAPTDRAYPGVEVISAGQGKEITDRLRVALEKVEAEYVLLTLDDYFFTQPIAQEGIDRVLEFMERNAVDYIQLFPQPKVFLQKEGARESEQYPGIYFVDVSHGDYKVVLTPGIWRTDFMRETLTDSMNPWQYEVSLTSRARQLNARCAASNCGEIPYLDVIRKGKVLRKAQRYFQKNPIYHSDREVMKREEEWILQIRMFLRMWLPRWAFRIAKKCMIKCGCTFYSPVS